MANQDNVATERSVKDFSFKALTKICLKNGIKTTSPERSNFLAVSAKYGLLFVACENGFSALRLRDLYEIDASHRQGKHLVLIKDYPTHASVDTTTTPSYLGVNCDSDILAVVHDVSGCPHAAMYRVESFTNPAAPPAAPYLTVRLSTTPGVTFTDAKWNPGVPGLLATCMSDSSANLWSIGHDSFTIQKTFRDNTGITALCWSPKGKQIVIGFTDGSLVQMDQMLSALKKKWPAPSLSMFEGRQCRVVDVLWESTYTFVVAYLPVQMNDREQPCFVVINVPPKEGQPSFTNFEDVCYSSGSNPLPKCFLNYIPAWGLCCVGMTNSLEICVLSKNAETKSWERWNVDDSGRAELPMTESSDDTYPLGAVLDYTSDKVIHLGDDRTHPPSPAIWILSSDATLVPFYLLYRTQDPTPLMTTPALLPSLQATPAPTTVQPPQSIFTPQTPTIAPHAASTPVAPRQFSFMPQVAATQPPPVAMTPPSQVIRTVFAEGDHAHIPPSYSLSSSGVQNFPPTAPPNVTITSGSVVKTSVGFEVKPPTTPVAPQISTNPVTQPATTVLTQAPTVTPAVNVTAETSINRAVDSEFTKNIHDEMSHFELELRALRTRSQGFESIGTKDELLNLEQRTAKMCRFNESMMETTKTQSHEVDDVNSVALDLFSMVEDGRTRLERNKDPRYHNLLSSQALDLASEEKVRSLEEACGYLEAGVGDVLNVLDAQWRSYQAQHGGGNGRMPFTDSAYHTLKMHRRIVSRQRTLLEQLRSRLNDIWQPDKTRLSWRSSSVGYGRAHTQTNDDASLTQLAESLLNVTTEQTTVPDAAKSRVISPKREEEMRNFFVSRQVTRVKSARVDHKTLSRFLSPVSRGQPTSLPPPALPPSAHPASMPPQSMHPPSTHPPSMHPQSLHLPHDYSTPPVGIVRVNQRPPAVNPGTTSTPVSGFTPTAKVDISQHVTKNLFGTSKYVQPITEPVSPVIPVTNQSQATNQEVSSNDVKPTFPAVNSLTSTNNKPLPSFVQSTTTSIFNAPVSSAPFVFPTPSSLAPNSFASDKTKSDDLELKNSTLSGFNFTSEKPKSIFCADNAKNSAALNSFSFSLDKTNTVPPSVSSPTTSASFSGFSSKNFPQSEKSDSPAPVTSALQSLLNDEEQSVISQAKNFPKIPESASATSLGFDKTSSENGSKLSSSVTSTNSSVAGDVGSIIPSGVVKNAIDTFSQPSSFPVTPVKPGSIFGGQAQLPSMYKPIFVQQKDDSVSGSGSETASKPESVTGASSSFSNAENYGVSVTGGATAEKTPEKLIPFGITEQLVSAKPSVFGASSVQQPSQAKPSIFGGGMTTGLFGKSGTFPKTDDTKSTEHADEKTGFFSPVSTTNTNMPTLAVPQQESPAALGGLTGAASLPIQDTGGDQAPKDGQSPNENNIQHSTLPNSANPPMSQKPPAFAFGMGATHPITTVGQTTTTPTTLFGKPVAFGQTTTAFESATLAFGQAVSSDQTPTAVTEQLPSPVSTAVTAAATTASIFGQSSSMFGQTSTTGQLFGQNKPTIFGQAAVTTTSSSMFSDQPKTSASSLFGQDASTSGQAFGQTTTTSSSIFGQQPAETSIFGQSTKPGTVFGQTNSAQNAFGPSSTASSGTAFGQTTTTFGQPATFSQPSIFGQTTQTTKPSTGVFGQSAGSNGLFGQSATSGVSKNLFGSSTTSSPPFQGSGGSLFGKTATTSAPTPLSFSQIQTKPSIFGQAVTSSAFGQSAFGQPATQQTGLFGQSTTTSQSGSVFGGGGSGGFMGGLGGQPSSETAGQNVFGSTNAFTSPPNQSSLFGGASTGTFGSFGSQSSPTTGAFTSGGSSNIGSSGFGVNPTTPSQSGFGGPATFGGSPVFGQKTFGFGQTSTFGTAAGQESTNVFGQTSTTTTGFSNSQSPTFGSLAHNPAAGFGAVPTTTPTFGSSPSFGSGFGANSPAFGSGSAFTGYRG